MPAANNSLPVLHYVHVPMCSWCWAFRPVWLKLQEKLQDKVTIKYVLGGLAADTDLPMPPDMQTTIRNTWEKIQREIPGTDFNYAFWSACQPRRSTYPACRAIIACRMQQPALEMNMLLAIQQAYYLQAKNPSDNDVLRQLAGSVGLDADKFSDDINSDTCEKLLAAEFTLARELYASSFPSLVLSDRNVDSTIKVDYRDSDQLYRQVIDQIKLINDSSTL